MIIQQWYFCYSGNQIGPLNHMEAVSQARENPNGHCWRQGFAEWLPIKQVDELQTSVQPSASVPPPLTTSCADEIDYKIFGGDMQFVEIELDPGESAISEAGAMMYKDPCIQLETVFGDGSRNAAQQNSGLFDKLVGAGKRLVTGESLFITVFTHKGSQGKAHVGFAAPFPGTIIPVALPHFDGRLICQKDSFLCAARGVSIGIHFQKKILTGLFGGEGFVMQKLEGDGMVFIHAGGTIVEKDLAEGQELHVDTGCLVALTRSVHYDIEQVGNIKSMLFGGEGVFFARLKGPGKVWLQSLPFSRLAGRMLSAGSLGGSKGEGSILGPLGDLLDGD